MTTIDTKQKARCWSVTINNPGPDDEEEIALARQKGWTVDGQLEKGKEGTPHYQLILRTPQVRFSAVKKAFSRAHIEVARNPAALQEYTHKVQSRLGGLPASSEKYPSLSKFWHLLLGLLNKPEKDCLDVCALAEGEVHFYRPEDDAAYAREPLVLFDHLVRVLIDNGYHVESIAVNPANRSMWKNYWRNILGRAYLEQCVKEAQEDMLAENTNADESNEACSEAEGGASSSCAPSRDGSPQP